MRKGNTGGRQRRRTLSTAFRSVRGGFVAVVLFSLFINLAMLISPIYMLQVYDRVLTSQSRDTLFYLTLLALVLLLVNAVVEVARSRLLVRIGARLDETLGKDLFAAAFRARLGGSDRSGSQTLRDLETMRTFMTGPGVLAIMDAPWTPIYLLFVFLLHPLLGVIALAGAGVIVVLALASEWAVRKPLREASSGARNSSDFTDQLARNADVVHAMGLLGSLTHRWQHFQHYSVAWQAIASDRMGILQAAAKFFRMALQIAILCAGAWLVLENLTTPGAMVAASIIMGRALAPVEAMIGQWRNLVGARQAAMRLEEALQLLDAEAGDRTRLPAPEGLLVVDNLGYKRPEAAAPTLHGVSFELKPGEVLGLIGPTGAGKSTLARLIVGLDEPSIGSIRLDGVEVSRWPREEFGPYVGYLPQDVALLNGSVATNIARFGDHDSDKIVAASRLAGTHGLIVNLPEGYETLIGEGGRALSGGQRQRIALARAVYGNARLIVLDEPNANLDVEGEKALRHTIGRLKEAGCTVVLISHKPSVVEAVDKLLVLKQGRVERFGDRDDVLAQFAEPASLKRIYAGRRPSMAVAGE